MMKRFLRLSASHLRRRIPSCQQSWWTRKLHHDAMKAASSSSSSSFLLSSSTQQTPSPCWQPATVVIPRQHQSSVVVLPTTGGNHRAAFSSAVSSSTELSSEGAVTSRLNDLIARGDVQPDEHQFEAAAELDRIHDFLMSHDPPPLKPAPSPATIRQNNSSSSFFGGFFGSTTAAAEWTIPPSVFNRGAYMFGGVGCGKTFLMNLFYDSIDSGPWANDKQKVHFHKFMLQVHQHMHQQRKAQKDPKNNGNGGDLITPVVDEILKQGRLLCLDEFQVTDVADAMILQLLFDGLWKKGCVLIATSNRPPSDLYLHGLQRDRFLPFIDRLQQQCTVVDLLDSETDYRMLANATSSSGISDGSVNSNGEDQQQQQQQPVVYFTKGGPASSKQFRNLFYKLAENHPTNPTSLSTQGRTVPIPLACVKKRIAFFDFADLCQKAMGAADYLVIASTFSTVFCHNIPKLTVNELNWLRRFITFVDTMYEVKVTLVLHTAQPVDSVRDLFSVDGDKKSYSQDEVFAFDRTLSRLEEMSSPKYLKSQWLGGSKKKRLEEKDRTLLKSSADWLLNTATNINTSKKTKEEDDAHNKITTKLDISRS